MESREPRLLLPLQRRTVPLAEVRGCGVGRLEKVHERAVRRRAGAHGFVREEELARGLNGCHRSIPLAPRGWRADRDCIRFGALIGTRCLVSCWALMLVCFASGHALAATAIVTGVGVGERFMGKPDRRVLGGVLFVAAGCYALL